MYVVCVLYVHDMCVICVLYVYYVCMICVLCVFYDWDQVPLMTAIQLHPDYTNSSVWCDTHTPHTCNAYMPVYVLRVRVCICKHICMCICVLHFVICDL